MSIDPVGVQKNFQSLSIRDLLEARDLYHFHLMNKANVVGTAVGLYLIRNSDPEPSFHHHPADSGHAKKPKPASNKPKGERNLANSGVRDYSWPAVLVFVNQWVPEDAFQSGGELHPDQMVPKTLYMPDGRMVPVCVVKIDTVEGDTDAALSRIQWPKVMLGGGYPVYCTTQRQEHHASLGCLLTDGHTLYALTNRHVAGDRGQELFTQLRGRPVRIGFTSGRQLTRREFSKVYPNYPGRQTWCNLDIGLVEVEDANLWTAEICGIGPLGDLADVHESNTSTALINAPVIAFGAASGSLEGRICALFYRFKSVGGYDYVSDFLIAPADPKSVTHPGDSGTVWLLKADKDHPLPRPIAVEWGAQSISGGAANNIVNLALATSLSNVCKLLDVELVHAHNTGAHVTWGATGHYSIGAYAQQLLQSSSLQGFISKNADSIAYQGAFDPKDIAQRLKDAKANGDFVPLADVPDIIWKNLPSKVKGGRDNKPGPHGSTGPEHPNHYADVDGDYQGTKFIDICAADPSKITTAFWKQYYNAIGKPKDSDMGLLPFRVWQIYNAMVQYVQAKNVAGFLCAAGVLSHYVGDACQPLHGSIYADGYSDQPQPVTHHKKDTGEEYQGTTWPGQGVHSTYEDKMVDDYATQLFDQVTADINAGVQPKSLVEGGAAAANETIQLMKFAQDTLPPSTIIDAYIQAGGGKSKATTAALYSVCGAQTAQLWLEGARTLACLWDSAWAEGNGDKIAASKLKSLDTSALQAIYEDPDNFVPSKYMSEIDQYLT